MSKITQAVSMATRLLTQAGRQAANIPDVRPVASVPLRTVEDRVACPTDRTVLYQECVTPVYTQFNIRLSVWFPTK